MECDYILQGNRRGVRRMFVMRYEPSSGESLREGKVSNLVLFSLPPPVNRRVFSHLASVASFLDRETKHCLTCKRLFQPLAVRAIVPSCSRTGKRTRLRRSPTVVISSTSFFLDRKPRCFCYPFPDNSEKNQLSVSVSTISSCFVVLMASSTTTSRIPVSTELSLKLTSMMTTS